MIYSSFKKFPSFLPSRSIMKKGGRKKSAKRRKKAAPISAPRQEAAFCNGGMWLFFGLSAAGFQGLPPWQIMNEHPCTSAHTLSLFLPSSLSLSCVTTTTVTPLPPATLDSPPRPRCQQVGTRMRPNQRGWPPVDSIVLLSSVSPVFAAHSSPPPSSAVARSAQPMGKKYAAGNVALA